MRGPLHPFYLAIACSALSGAVSRWLSIGLIDLGQVKRVWRWAGDSTVVGRITRGARVVHGDLTAAQVFVAADGYRVVDWQRPVLAPPDVDLVALLVDQDIDPRPHVDVTTVGAFWFLRLHWAVEAQARLFPDRSWPLFDQWAAEAISHILE